MILEKEVEVSGNKYTIRQISIREKAELDNYAKKAYADDIVEFAKNVDQWFFYLACIYGLVPPEEWETDIIKGKKYLKENELYKISESDIVTLALDIYMFCRLNDEDKKKLK